jgi:hypothetical protein
MAGCSKSLFDQSCCDEFPQFASEHHQVTINEVKQGFPLTQQNG